LGLRIKVTWCRTDLAGKQQELPAQAPAGGESTRLRSKRSPVGCRRIDNVHQRRGMRPRHPAGAFWRAAASSGPRTAAQRVRARIGRRSGQRESRSAAARSRSGSRGEGERCEFGREVDGRPAPACSHARRARIGGRQRGPRRRTSHRARWWYPRPVG
jgi:hypothetical protein